MAGYNNFAFDPAQVTEFFKSYDMTKFFPAGNAPQVDPSALMDAQKKNMEALVEANQKAAEGYKALFEKQVKVFEDTMAEARKQAEGFDATKMSPDAAKEQAEYAKVAFEKALKNMTILAEEAQKANSEAFKVVSARIEDSVKELQALAAKFTA